MGKEPWRVRQTLLKFPNSSNHSTPMHSFPFPTNGNFILPVAQAKTVGSTLTLFCRPIHKQTLLVPLPRQNWYLATAHTWISAKVLPLASKLPHSSPTSSSTALPSPAYGVTATRASTHEAHSCPGPPLQLLLQPGCSFQRRSGQSITSFVFPQTPSFQRCFL